MDRYRLQELIDVPNFQRQEVLGQGTSVFFGVNDLCVAHRSMKEVGSFYKIDVDPTLIYISRQDGHQKDASRVGLGSILPYSVHKVLGQRNKLRINIDSFLKPNTYKLHFIHLHLSSPFCFRSDHGINIKDNHMRIKLFKCEKNLKRRRPRCDWWTRACRWSEKC